MYITGLQQHELRHIQDLLLHRELILNPDQVTDRLVITEEPITGVVHQGILTAEALHPAATTAVITAAVHPVVTVEAALVVTAGVVPVVTAGAALREVIVVAADHTVDQEGHPEVRDLGDS